MSKNLTETLNKITQTWFLAEPLLFSVFCSHEFVANEKLHIPFRTGKMRIEYCPQIIENLTEHEIAEYLKIEVFRILLKHPYQRQPTGAKKPYLSIASDAVIYTNYTTDVVLDGIKTIEEMMLRITAMQHGFSNKTQYATTESSRFENSSPLQIPAPIIHDYLNKLEATKIEAVKDGFIAKVDKITFLYQLDEDEKNGSFYQVMRFNELLQRYENVYGTSINNFWSTKLRFGANNSLLLPKDLCFEEWYSKILAVMNFMTEEGDEDFEDGNTGGERSEDKQKKEKRKPFDNLSELTGLWEEDDQTQQKINDMIDDAEKAQQWGSVSGDIKDLIQANKKVDMNYVDILRHFSTSIVATKRNLTRMKPNRRFGFDRLGSRYNLTSNLLIAVDISSSITKENLEYVFSVINSFFRYGVEKIDVIQFDAQIQGEVVEMKRAAEYIQINGRGGTDFQPAADFYCNHKEYDGMIYFTDGFGPHPEFKGRINPNVLWIFTTKSFYDKGIKWTSKIPGNNATYIPLP